MNLQDKISRIIINAHDEVEYFRFKVQENIADASDYLIVALISEEKLRILSQQLDFFAIDKMSSIALLTRLEEVVRECDHLLLASTLDLFNLDMSHQLKNIAKRNAVIQLRRLVTSMVKMYKNSVEMLCS